MGHDSFYGIDFATLEGAAAGVREPSERLIDFIYYKVTLILGESPDRDEATSDVFLRIIDEVSCHRFNPAREGTPSAWAAKVAVRKAIDYKRSATRHQTRFVVYEVVPEPTDPSWEDPSVYLGDRQMVTLALAFRDALDENDRAIIVLRYEHELSQEELAEALEIPIGTVKSRLSRAEGKLRAAMMRAMRKTTGRRR